MIESRGKWFNAVSNDLIVTELQVDEPNSAA